jgi:hypothetical protein
VLDEFLAGSKGLRMYNFVAYGLFVQMGASQGHFLNAVTFLDCCFLVDAKLGCKRRGAKLGIYICNVVYPVKSLQCKLCLLSHLFIFVYFSLCSIVSAGTIDVSVA